MMGYILFLVVVFVLVMQKGSGSINNRKKHKETNRAWYDISTEDLIDYDMFFDD